MRLESYGTTVPALALAHGGCTDLHLFVCVCVCPWESNNAGDISDTIDLF